MGGWEGEKIRPIGNKCHNIRRNPRKGCDRIHFWWFDVVFELGIIKTLIFPDALKDTLLFLRVNHNNPFALRAAKRGIMILKIFCSQKRFIEKCLTEKCWSAAKHNSPFKYFVNFHFIPKLLSNVWEKQEELQVLMG